MSHNDDHCRWCGHNYTPYIEASDAVRAALRDPWTGQWGKLPAGVLSVAETIVWNHDPDEEGGVLL